MLSWYTSWEGCFNEIYEKTNFLLTLFVVAFMDIQLFIVIIIGIVTGIILLRQIYYFFFIQKDHTRCGSCNMCDLPKKESSSGS